MKYFCCTFVPSCFFKFHVKKKMKNITSGIYLKGEISILSHLCSARNSKLFPFIGCFTLNLAGPSPRPRPPKGGSSSQVKAEMLHQKNTYKKCTLLLLFLDLKEKTKVLLWSVKTFISSKFKGSLLVHCITWKNVPRSLIPFFIPLSKPRSWQPPSLVLKQCFPLKLLNEM